MSIETKSENAVIVNKKGCIAQITLNSPATRNAISEMAVVDSLVAALEALDADESLRVIVLTGAGKSFCSGGNVKHMANRQDMFAGDEETLYQNYQQGIQRIPKAMRQITLPVIAAVNGAAYGAGCDLAMMCDIRIASTSATFAENFVKVGIIPGDGGAWFLPKVIGWARASEMALTGEPIDATTALEWGMVSRVVEPEQLMDEAFKLADRVAANPPNALRQTKRLLREGLTASLDEHLEACARIQSRAHHSDEHKEAIKAILEKRPAKF